MTLEQADFTPETDTEATRMTHSTLLNMQDMPALEAKSYVPLYAQLAERFATVIRRSHASLVGAPLPSEAECTDYFKVSRPTVRQAMAQLLNEGLILRGRGKGTFVAPQRINHDLSHAFEDEMRVAQRAVAFELLDRMDIEAPDTVAQALRLQPGAKVERIRRLRLLEGKVFGYEERYVAAERARLISDAALNEKAIVSLIRDFAKEAPTRFSLTISSVRANAEYARLLDVPRGAPLLSSQHTYFLASGEPALHGIVLFHGENYQFTVQTEIRPIDAASGERNMAG
ncbi:GntR family transcriptional regulator [Ferrovibrio sp.]|uniref:GntR family transcriptional regulator n=1 Tax=Ferrovibrio sp. TaxID=1917215 RepID=UPI0025C34D1B|nr:GntR family transcriptional regulator [Ferrovibrio sp.]MBX3453663.1 GntR family transcriptional regulator [Ferrovibrio sp.]